LNTTIHLCDYKIKITHTYNLVSDYLKDFACQGRAKDEIIITQSDIQSERAAACETSSDAYLEVLAIARKVFTCLADYGAILFHCCAVEYDGKAYLFAAPSGTGKSTHAALWLKLLGDKAKILNGDKPLIKINNGVPYLYGTPFMGKENLGYNGKAPIGGICFIYRSAENSIIPITPTQAFTKAYFQTFKPNDAQKLKNVLEVVINLINKVPLYEIGCNISLEAAKMSFETMTKRMCNNEIG